jgi:PAS domain S-box-containing protein
MDRDTLLWIMASLAVLMNAVVGIYNIDRMLDRDRAVTGHVAAQVELNGVLSQMKDAETGQRGFILTGKPAYLQPFTTSRTEMPARVQKLRERFADDPEQLAGLGELETLVAAKFAEMQRVLDVRDVQGPDAAAEAISTDTGKELMDRIRAVTAALVEYEEARITEDQSESGEQRWTALMTLIIGAVMAVGIILSAAAIIRVEMARRQAAFAALKALKDTAEQSLNRLDAFVQNAPCGIAYYDADLRYLRANDAFAKINGVPAEDHIGKSIDEVRPDFPPALRQECLEVSRTQIPAINRRLDFGDEVWEISVFPVKAVRTERPGVGIIGIDVTEKAAAEDQVRESEARFRTMAEAMPQIVWMARPDGYHEYYNLRWYEFTGLTAEESIGFGWSVPLHPDDVLRSRSRWKLSVENGLPYEAEYRFRDRDGNYRWFLARANPIRNAAGKVSRWLGTCTDIDDNRRQAERLEELVDRRTLALRRSNEELEKFAYIASHDLQEPLRKIQAFGDRLSTRFKAGLGEQGQDYIARMLDSSGRMRRLIDDLLLFSRVATKLEPPGQIDLNPIAADVVDDLELRITQTGGRVEVGPLPAIPADPAQMRQLLQNLIGNALKFQRPGVPPVVTVTATPWDELTPAAAGATPPPEGEGVRIRVADNGIGFEPQYADRIFELFQRLHGRNQYEGTGLGLAICKKIVERHGGAIAAESCPGEGSAFIIDLPLIPDFEPSHAAPSEDSYHSGRR